jgi:predicted nucleic acid-binding protein
MIRCVIDASSVGPLILPDEAENLIPGLVQALGDEVCITPGHWRFEVGNLALMAVRRKRVEVDDIVDGLNDLDAFTIATDTEGSDLAWGRTLTLARDHGLTLYDAAYLELAMRRSLSLYSSDRALLAVAASVGVKTNSTP